MAERAEWHLVRPGAVVRATGARPFGPAALPVAANDNRPSFNLLSAVIGPSLVVFGWGVILSMIVVLFATVS